MVQWTLIPMIYREDKGSIKPWHYSFLSWSFTAAPRPGSVHWQLLHFQHWHKKISNFSFFPFPKLIITFLYNDWIWTTFNRYDSSQVTNLFFHLSFLWWMGSEKFRLHFPTLHCCCEIQKVNKYFVHIWKKQTEKWQRLRMWICKVPLTTAPWNHPWFITYQNYLFFISHPTHTITCSHGIVFQMNQKKHHWKPLNMD